ncbi:MAG: type II secretion system inner membrane protein GspF [Gammaproteobacteria bacterium]|nr:type II secretion system inner membrane protein GspF [Gammaproteobacteria bacterium]NNJ95344.1 type II secretion system inner membrane protein GspF [Halobacteria archaeon]
MGAFEYTVLDPAGREKKGVMEGDAPRQVRQQLREKGLVPLSVQEVAQRETRSHRQFSLFRRGISATDLALVTRQLATLVKAALPLEECLRAASQQTDRSRLKSMLLAVRSRVMEGHTLATGLGDFKHVFPELYRTTVEAGEQSGHLDRVLERLADYTENRQQMRQKIQLAVFYPAMLTVVAILVVGGLMTYVVPQVVQVFDNIGQNLPPLTVGMIAVSDFMRDYGLLLLLSLVLAGILFYWLLRNEDNRRRFHRMQLSLPLVGRLVRGMNTGRFARTFSILTASGVSVLEALRISSQVISNLPMRDAVDEATARVREGASIAAALETSGYFPPMTVHLIASGESSGKLEEMLERAAIFQEREIETMIAALLGLFEPMLILVMGGVVLIIVLAILLPIFDLNQLVQ